MDRERTIRGYRRWYARLLRLYPKPHYERFGEGMEQTFSDLLRERAAEGRGLFCGALWMFVETSVGIFRENLTHTIAQNKRLIGILLAASLVLLLPLVAMQFTEEVDWDLFDFAVMGVLLFGTGITFEVAARMTGNTAYRAAVGIALAAVFLLVWINGAVGTEDDSSGGLIFLGVLVLGIGSTIARFRSRGMERALFATAFAQALVAVIAMIAWGQYFEAAVLNGFFTALFVGSALLFRRAARPRS